MYKRKRTDREWARERDGRCTHTHTHAKHRLTDQQVWSEWQKRASAKAHHHQCTTPQTFGEDVSTEEPLTAAKNLQGEGRAGVWDGETRDSERQGRDKESKRVSRSYRHQQHQTPHSI